jgi:hypothetical protein
MKTQELVRQLAEDAVAAISAPQAELFAVVAPAYLQNPAKMLEAGQRDETLGIGVGVAETLLIAAAIYVADAVIEQLISRATDAGLDRTRSRVGRWWSRKSKKDDPVPESVFPVTSVTAETLRETALEKGIQAGLAQPQAQLLADAIVGNLLGRKG